MNVLHVRLLGEFSLIYGDQPVATVNTARLQSLLAYLLLHRDAPQSRYHLAFQFWPGSTESQARTNLRKLFHQLHQALPDADCFLSADTHTLQWRPDALFSLDVTEFEGAISLTASLEALREAIAFYRGDLLPSCYDDWVLPERERLRQAFMEATERLVALLEDARDYQAASHYAQGLLQHDPLYEATYRQLMRLHALRGNRASALRVYHACTTILQRELGVEPSSATREVYEQLLNREPATASLHGAKTPVAFALVGRQAEWARLQATWQSAASAGPHLALISGEAGIGKTRLAEETLQWADRQGIRTASARCYAAEGALAFAPVTTWLRAHPLPSLSPLWLSEVARLLPEVLTDSLEVPAPGPLPQAWQRQRLLEALARAILGGHQPLLLLLDNLQWCDRETLEWVRYLLRFDPQMRLLVLGTLRSEESAAEHALAPLLADLRCSEREGSPQLIEIELEPLDEAETGALAAQVAGRALDTALTTHLFRETEGNPLFVVETVRMGLPTTGRLAIARALPPKVHAVLAARLAQLSPPARDLAGVAAVIGRAFSVDVLSQASHVGEEALVHGLDELWQRRIVREQGAAWYDFSHDKLREVAYTSLGVARRRLLHRRVAEALETLHAGDLDSVSGQLASHYDEAGLIGQAVRYYQRAAEVTWRAYAQTEAIAYLSRALDLTPETDRVGRYALLLAREKAYDLQARRDAQACDLTALKALSESLDDGQRAEVALRESRYAEATSDYHAAIVAAQTAIDLGQASGDVGREAAGHLQWGRALWQQGDYATAHVQLEQALQLARTTQLSDVEADTHYNIAGVAALQDDYAKARDNAGQAYGLYHRTGNRQGELRALNVMGVAFHSQGDYVEAEAQFDLALHLSQEIGERRTEGVILRNLGGLAWGQGDYARAQACVEQSLRCCRESGDRRSESETLAFLGLISHCLGDNATARENSWQAIHLAQSVGARHEEGFALACLGHALMGLGQLAEAADAYRQALMIQRELGESNSAMESLAGLACIALTGGDPVQALAHVEEILSHLEHSPLDGTEEPFRVYLTCYRVLLAHQDLRAGDILNFATTLLQERATKIANEELRRSFLEQVSAHREIAEAWARQHVRTPPG